MDSYVKIQLVDKNNVVSYPGNIILAYYDSCSGKVKSAAATVGNPKGIDKVIVYPVPGTKDIPNIIHLVKIGDSENQKTFFNTQKEDTDGWLFLSEDAH